MALLPRPPKSDTVEGAFLEIALLMQRAEASTRLNPEKKANMTMNIDLQAGVATIAIRLPIYAFESREGVGIRGKEYTEHLEMLPREFTEAVTFPITDNVQIG